MNTFVEEARRLAARDVADMGKAPKGREELRAQKAAIWIEMFGAQDLVEHLASLKGMTAEPGSIQ